MAANRGWTADNNASKDTLPTPVHLNLIMNQPCQPPTIRATGTYPNQLGAQTSIWSSGTAPGLAAVQFRSGKLR